MFTKEESKKRGGNLKVHEGSVTSVDTVFDTGQHEIRDWVQ